MAFSNTKPETISGTCYWAQIIGSPKPGYDPEEKQWTVDIVPDSKGLERLSYLGLTSRLKPDERGTHDGKDFLKFYRREFKRNTSPPKANQPIDIIYKDGGEGDLIGNGSEVSVEFNVYDVPAKGRLPATRGTAILSVTVLKLVTYVRPEEDNSQDAVETRTKRKQVNSGVETWKGDVA